jgi:hypothetical protein
MLRTFLLILLFSSVLVAAPTGGSMSFLENRVIPVFMALNGLAMAGIWTVDISKKGTIVYSGRTSSPNTPPLPVWS